MADGAPEVTPLDRLLHTLIAREGGVADVGDGKGITRWGQTAVWLDQFNLPVPKSPDDAIMNYRVWLAKVRLFSLVEVGDNLADILLDIAVMSSAPKAVKALQATLGIPVDGIAGAQVFDAVQRAASREILAHLVVAWDMEYQGSVITLNPQRAAYAKGWAVRMAGHVRAFI